MEKLMTCDWLSLDLAVVSLGCRLEALSTIFSKGGPEPRAQMKKVARLILAAQVTAVAQARGDAEWSSMVGLIDYIIENSPKTTEARKRAAIWREVSMGMAEFACALDDYAGRVTDDAVLGSLIQAHSLFSLLGHLFQEGPAALATAMPTMTDVERLFAEATAVAGMPAAFGLAKNMASLEPLRRDYQMVLNLRQMRFDTPTARQRLTRHLWKAEDILLNEIIATWSEDELSLIGSQLPPAVWIEGDH